MRRLIRYCRLISCINGEPLEALALRIFFYSEWLSARKI